MIPRAAERLADDVAFPFPSLPSRSYPVLSSPAPAPAPVHSSHPAHLLLQKATLPPPAPRPEPLLATTFVGIPLYPLACSVTDSLRSARKRDTSRATAPVSARPRLATSVETRVTLCAHHLFALRAFRLTPTVCSPASAPRTPPVEPPTEVLPTEEPLEEEDSSATRYVPSPSPSRRRRLSAQALTRSCVSQCNEVGHISRNCPQNGGGGGGYGGGCTSRRHIFCRGSTDAHLVPRRTAAAAGRLRRRIRSPRRTVRRTRQDLREFTRGVESENCTDRRIRLQYTCGGVGHLSRDCTTQQKCFNCGQPGHISNGCTSAPQAKACVSPILLSRRFSH